VLGIGLSASQLLHEEIPCVQRDIVTDHMWMSLNFYSF
jgi:hypothetical protein